MTNLFDRHYKTLSQALTACETRSYWSPFTESPSGRLHPEGSAAKGKARFEDQLGKPFELDQPGEIGRTGYEISPYTQEPLGIDYPQSNPDALFNASQNAIPKWRDAGLKARTGICIEMLFELEKQCFENAYATMHTAGQTYLMAFSGSGANALDRGMEALAYAYKAQLDIPNTAHWEKNFGRTGDVRLKKTYEIRPRGTAIVICCATFPLWNAYPAIFANLMTGNPVIVKPHPNGILPVAMAVRTCRAVLQMHGFDPNLVLMAADTAQKQITIDLLEHPMAKIIDYTGSQRFGTWIEKNCANKLVYTETAGCNAVVVHSTNDIDGLIAGLANCLCTFSAQMCTSPQNIHVPQSGIETDKGHMSYDAFCKTLTQAITDRTENGVSASRICGAIQSNVSLDIISRLTNEKSGTVLLSSKSYDHPDFPNSRTATPLVMAVSAQDKELYTEEHFAPVSFVIRENDAKAALENASKNAEQYGAIASYVYTSDPEFLNNAKRMFADAGASLWCNMDGRMPINFAAAYSDYHVTGLNPAGNACLADLAFVANRFRIIQFREPA